jgi:hypothetical protein
VCERAEPCSPAPAEDQSFQFIARHGFEFFGLSFGFVLVLIFTLPAPPNPGQASAIIASLTLIFFALSQQLSDKPVTESTTATNPYAPERSTIRNSSPLFLESLGELSGSCA